MRRMKSFALKMLCIALCLPLALAFTACGGGTKGDNELYITFFKGGYGEQWAYTLADKFMDENPGIEVHLEPDSSLYRNIDSVLKNGSEFDLIFCHNYSFETYAALGLLENLDSLYATDVGGGVTFEKRIQESALPSAKLNGNYWKVPWTLGTGGIAYNQAILDKVNTFNAGRGVDRRYENGVKTYNELVNACADIVAAQIPQDAKNPNGAKVVPFTWSGDESWFWDFIVFEWWAQLSGLDALEEFKKFETADIYDPDTKWKGFKQAYTLWYDLIVANKNYSLGGSDGATKLTNQSSFVNGKAAFMPAANWVEYETKGVAPAGFEMRIMSAPVIENVVLDGETLNAKTDADGNPIKVGYTVSYGDNVVIPKSTDAYPINVELAKKFLIFMQKEENALLFTKETGGTILPYKYDYTKVPNPTKFQNDIFSINAACNKFNFYSQSPMQLHSSLIGSSTTGIVWPLNQYYYVTSFAKPAEYAPGPTFTGIYNTVKQGWPLWRSEAGL